MAIRSTTSEDIKAKLRKMKTLPGTVKAALLKGCQNQMVYVQFHQDLATYGLWESLLYVEGYEQETGGYAVGTAQAALDAYLKK